MTIIVTASTGVRGIFRDWRRPTSPSGISLAADAILAENSCVAKEWEQKKEKVPLLLVESAFL